MDHLMPTWRLGWGFLSSRAVDDILVPWRKPGTLGEHDGDGAVGLAAMIAHDHLRSSRALLHGQSAVSRVPEP